jgi:hypothetical protein
MMIDEDAYLHSGGGERVLRQIEDDYLVDRLGVVKIEEHAEHPEQQVDHQHGDEAIHQGLADRTQRTCHGG